MKQLKPATPQPADSRELASELQLVGHGMKPHKYPDEGKKKHRPRNKLIEGYIYN